MAATTYNITIEQGITFEIQFTLRDNASIPINLTGYTFQSAIVESTNGDSMGSFTFTTVDAAAGVFKMSMATTVTSQIPESSTLIWDLIAQDSNNVVKRYLEGSVNVIDTATSTDFS
tara:strand:+ start:1032 stop:1382 length:351 start_codon:yes stop_codon:yes gene_type:complete